MAAAVEKKPRTFPVVEVFGPTIQGEGALAGMPTHFVRFGGCDFRCEWCDSMYAVEPELVRKAARLTAQEIGTMLHNRNVTGGLAEWVTLSGGNPALYDLAELVTDLHELGFKVSVETQGSRWRPWLATVDCLTVSPKPPSSGMVNDGNATRLERFLLAALNDGPADPTARCLKIVVFDDADFDWARGIFEMNPAWPAYLSVGTNPVGQWGSEVVKRVSDREVRDEVGERYRWLCDKIAGDPWMQRVRVLPQLHVLAWGHSRGV